jgi:CTP synthase (UTP-ammonia lyase)
VITRLSCSLRGLEQEVLITPGTMVARAYGRPRVMEKFLCSFGLNERYRATLLGHGLRASGEDCEGNLRIVELGSHPFFAATLFVPQLSSGPGAPHPLIVAFVKVAAGCQY